MIIYAKLQSSRVRHQYGIFGGKSQTSFTRNATRAGSEEGRLFSQATFVVAPEKDSNQIQIQMASRNFVPWIFFIIQSPISRVVLTFSGAESSESLGLVCASSFFLFLCFALFLFLANNLPFVLISALFRPGIITRRY